MVASRSLSYSESCYFFLSVYGIKQGTNGIFAPVIYSDNEKRIGVWRDNKPLYQRTWSGLSLTSNINWYSTGIDISFVDTIVNGFSNDMYGQRIEESYGNDNGTLYSRSQFANQIITTITLLYTKTADVAGSGNWNTDGVPTIHYSTSEQVIGTWIDGKPLYEITLNPTVNRGSNTLNHGIANFKECIRIFGKCKYNNTAEVLPLPYVSTNTQYVIACGNVTSTTYLVDVGNGFTTIQDCYVTIQYTKTTD